MLNRKLLVVIFVSVITSLLSGCFNGSEASSEVPEQILNKLFSDINNMSCEGKCKDFVKVCSKSNIVSSADKLNGVSESVFTGFTYALYIDAYKKYYDRKMIALFEKRNGVWTASESRDNGIDIKTCTW